MDGALDEKAFKEEFKSFLIMMPSAITALKSLQEERSASNFLFRKLLLWDTRENFLELEDLNTFEKTLEKSGEGLSLKAVWELAGRDLDACYANDVDCQGILMNLE